MDYRCRECGAVYNLFTDTIWSGTRYSCRTIVSLLRGIALGVPNIRLAAALKLDRSNLIERRRKIEPGALRLFRPASAGRQR